MVFLNTFEIGGVNLFNMVFMSSKGMASRSVALSSLQPMLCLHKWACEKNPLQLITRTHCQLTVLFAPLLLFQLWTFTQHSSCCLLYCMIPCLRCWRKNLSWSFRGGLHSFTSPWSFCTAYKCRLRRGNILQDSVQGLTGFLTTSDESHQCAYHFFRSGQDCARTTMTASISDSCSIWVFSPLCTTLFLFFIGITIRLP